MLWRVVGGRRTSMSGKRKVKKTDGHRKGGQKCRTDRSLSRSSPFIVHESNSDDTNIVDTMEEKTEWHDNDKKM